MAGTYVLTDTIGHAFDEVFTQATAGLDVEVRAPVSFTGQASIDRGRIPSSVLEDVQGVDGVAVAEGGVSGYAQMIDKQGEAILPSASSSMSGTRFRLSGSAWGSCSSASPC